MEGRAIARPNPRYLPPGPPLPGQTQVASHHACCFNGGPSNCPAKPGESCHAFDSVIERRFNGGPSNCPAKPLQGEGKVPGQTSGPGRTRQHRPLQWRAEQLPGQTVMAAARRFRSMEAGGQTS